MSGVKVFFRLNSVTGDDNVVKLGAVDCVSDEDDPFIISYDIFYIMIKYLTRKDIKNIRLITKKYDELCAMTLYKNKFIDFEKINKHDDLVIKHCRGFFFMGYQN